VSEVLASVLAREPDWTRLPPPAFDTTIRRCLHKNAKQRIADAQDVRLALEGAFDTAAPQTSAPVFVAQPVGWLRVAILTTSALVIGAALAGTLVWVVARPAEPAPPRVSRLQVTPGGAAALSVNGAGGDLAITPDGSRLVYIGNHGTQLFVRALGTLEPLTIFTGSALRGLFVSPDGHWIGFAESFALKKVAVTGGPAVTITTLDGSFSGAMWGSDDTIIVATLNPATGLQRVTAAGGPTTLFTRPDRAQGERDHLWPELLPGGRAVLFTITALTGGLDAAQVVVLDLQTGKRTVLVRGGMDAHYVPSGHLVYAAAGTLRAVAFDLARLQTHGTPVPVIPAVGTNPCGGVDAVVAADGTLAYMSGGLGGVADLGALRTLVWVDRQGRETPIPAPPHAYVFPRVSPDGTGIAVYAVDQERDLWLWDLDDVMQMRLDGTRRVTPLLQSPFADRNGVVSPDGR
jgi:hypothetical protein